MKKIWLSLILLPLIFAPITLAQENFRTNEVATLGKQETINKDYFAWGEKVVLSGTVNGDAYLAGGNIIIDGVVNGDLLVAGGDVNIIGQVAGNVRTAGGNVQIDGQVGRNVTAAGGNVKVGKGAQIGGSLVAGTGNLEVFGPVAKDITAGGGSVTLANQVGSDVLAGANKVDLTSGAKVKGNLTYYSSETATIASEATVSGQVVHNLPPQQPRQKAAAGFKTGWNIFSFLSCLALGLVLIWLVPRLTQSATNNVLGKPWASLGFGFLILILVPILILVLAMTLIGIPLAIVTTVYFIFLLLFAKIFTAMAIGQRLMIGLNQKTSQGITFAVGLLLLAILGFIPILGGLVTLVAMLLGLGADFLAKKDLFLELRSKKSL